MPINNILRTVLATTLNRTRAYLAVCFCAVCCCSSSFADWRDDVDFTKLATALGDSLPEGAGVPISLVEAGDGSSSNFYPNVNDVDFSAGTDPLGTAVNFINGSSAVGSGFSNHADFQARRFFGNTFGVAPAANEVTIYEANDYLANVLNNSGINSDPPDAQDFRVQNFSWVGDSDTDNEDRESLRRFDYAIEANNITAFIGVSENNTSNPLPHLLSHSYNAIAVGRTAGVHAPGLTRLADYGVGRSKPELVVPLPSNSAATSAASSSATLLHSAATVQGTDAANSETMKAILLAGATKDEFAAWSQIDSSGEWHPLDDTFGAGQLNLYNSYLVTLGGQVAGSTTAPTPVASYGWDYQNVQEGAGNEVLYDFVIPSGTIAKELSIALTWNAKITAPFNTGDPTVANLGLELVDNNGLTVDLDLSDTHADGLSDSDVDNVEHIYLTDLAAGTYTLKVSSDDLDSDFGLAWRTSTLFETFSADFDEDGDTDGADFLAWQRGFGTLINATHSSGDADGDGDVDADDLAIYNAATSVETASLSSLIASVPEPEGWVLVGIGLLLALGFRNFRYQADWNS